MLPCICRHPRCTALPWCFSRSVPNFEIISKHSDGPSGENPGPATALVPGAAPLWALVIRKRDHGITGATKQDTERDVPVNQGNGGCGAIQPLLDGKVFENEARNLPCWTQDNLPKAVRIKKWANRGLRHTRFPQTFALRRRTGEPRSTQSMLEPQRLAQIRATSLKAIQSSSASLCRGRWRARSQNRSPSVC